MSKELEALDIITQVNVAIDQYTHDKMVELIRKALTPPTASEVCKALSEYLNKSVYYEKRYFLYRKEEFYNQPFIIAYKYKSGLVELTKNNVLPPHLITLIGKFYEVQDV